MIFPKSFFFSILRIGVVYFSFPLVLIAQGTGIPLGNPSYHILDRLQIKTNIPAPFHSSLKYYTRGDAARYALTIDTSQVALTSRDRIDLYYIFKDNNEWLMAPDLPTTLSGRKKKFGEEVFPSQIEASMDNARYIMRKPILKYFYNTPANFFEINEPYFHLRVNPILNIQIGRDQEEEQTLLYNRRGIELRGGIDDRVYFFMNILETQARFPDYVNDWIERFDAVPGQGLFKRYESDVFNIDDGYDFLNGQGYLGFSITPHLGTQIGFGRNFIGNGYRSLLLSDFSNNYFYLKLNWKVWKFHYQNLFAELIGERGNIGNVEPIKKYMATHHLSFDILPNLNVGIFESVIFARRGGIELQYLNPVIFYRLVEQGLGSPDNVLIGIDGKWNFLRRFQLYGQFILDEFLFRELITENRGWWANKYGLQVGAKYIDAFGIDQLDVQVEYNTARPYTYTHTDSTSNYTHYNQPLAHPLGANFREQLVLLRYRPTKKLEIESRLIFANFGEDQDSTNFGGNILLSNRTRNADFNNETGQGVEANTVLFGLDISYQLGHNIFLDLNYAYRRMDSELDARDNTFQYFGGGFRMNIGRQRYDF